MTQIIKKAAANRQFGASGGVVSWDTSQDFGSFAPVRALPIPPPAASCHHVVCQAAECAYINRNRFF